MAIPSFGKRGAAIAAMGAIALVAIFAGVVTPTVRRFVEDGRRTRAARACRRICDALAAYRDDHGTYPPGLQGDATYNYANGTNCGFGAEVLNAWLVEGERKYLDEPIGLDPWESLFNYQLFTRSNPYMDVVVFSNGPDRVCDSWDASLWNRGRFAGDDIGALCDRVR